VLRAATIALLAAAVTAAPAAAAIKPTQDAPLGHEGRWVTDRKGRVLVLHGFNMVYKRPPYHPIHAGFGRDDARFLARHGFNTIRLGVIYAGVEPEPGQYDDAYLAKIAKTQRMLARHGIYSLLDWHQDLYNERFEGEGWPDWAVQDDGMPAEPKNGFPVNYLTMPALNRAFDHFWANDPGPEGVGLVDRYAAAYKHFADRFKTMPGLLGYDLMNEPWPGSTYPSCVSTEGCPAFDQGPLSEFTLKTIEAIREVDTRAIAWYEPLLTFDFGAKTSHVDPQDPRAGFSYHVYCLPAAFGGPAEDDCETFEDMPMEYADQRSEETNDALLMTEFGATDNVTILERVARLADEHMVGWQEWHYCACDEPTSQAAPEVQATVIDPKKPPKGENLKKETLEALSRPYPQVVAGTPVEWEFDPEEHAFTVTYEKTRASGKGRFKRGLTDIFVAKLHYPDGYRAKVKGARVVSKPNARHLLLRGRRRADKVSLTLRARTG
jgi:endoglycosylceramidase